VLWPPWARSQPPAHGRVGLGLALRVAGQGQWPLEDACGATHLIACVCARGVRQPPGTPDPTNARSALGRACCCMSAACACGSIAHVDMCLPLSVSTPTAPLSLSLRHCPLALIQSPEHPRNRVDMAQAEVKMDMSLDGEASCRPPRPFTAARGAAARRTTREYRSRRMLASIPPAPCDARDVRAAARRRAVVRKGVASSPVQAGG